jgi:pyrroloquinoline quinone biosynthesis protein B
MPKHGSSWGLAPVGRERLWLAAALLAASLGAIVVVVAPPGHAVRAAFAARAAHADEGAPFLVVLGVAQDGGHPHAACMKPCCVRTEAAGGGDASQGDTGVAAGSEPDCPGPTKFHLVSCLALLDPAGDRRFVFDATPDFPDQLRILDTRYPIHAPRARRDLGLDGIFLTHAHIGHYTGLMHVGREVAGAQGIPVYAMPRMLEFLETNGPWSQLVTLGNIEPRPLFPDLTVELGAELSVTPVLVPHRDEYSETVGFFVQGPRRLVLFLPDIDKWERWDRELAEVLALVDRAYVDGSFYAEGEIPGRAMSEIPHPFIEETLARVAGLPAEERDKLWFIHLNHTNPALDGESEAAAGIRAAGCHLAAEGDEYGL